MINEKIKINDIISDHITTLRKDGKNSPLRKRDIVTFYIIPILAGILLSYCGGEISKDASSLAITVFAIFAALLFSAQVAMYGIFKSTKRNPRNQTDQAIMKAGEDDEKKLFREVNANISYLIFTSSTGIVSFYLMHIYSLNNFLSKMIIFTILTHFALKLAMLLKRSHLLFDNSYK